MRRRGGEQSFEGLYPYRHISFSYHSPRKLEGVIIRLEPLSKQHTLIGFLRNTDNAKTLTGFTQELVNAITDYQVWTSNPVVVISEQLARFLYIKGYMRRQGTSTMIPGISMMIPRISW